MKSKVLIVDTAAFISALPLWELAEQFYTVQEVLDEIRDKKTRRSIAALPIELKIRSPLPESLKFINEFTKKTGDFANLSYADALILALTYELEVEESKTSDHLRKEPQQCRTTVETYKPKPSSADSCDKLGWYSPDDKTKESSSEFEVEVQMEEETEDVNSLNEEDENDSDDEGWVTPASVRRKKEKAAKLSSENDKNQEPENVQVACITADYSMQNTLKHIGLNVMGVDGKLITRVRTYILRCYGCFKTTDKMETIFCHHCGHKTLKKVSVTLNPDGTQKIWISTKRPINLRGSIFTLPAPKGGKHAINPILVADQREAQQRATKLSRIKNDPMHEDYGAKISPFVTRDVYSRSAQLGIIAGKNQHRGLFYWEQKNPNEQLKSKKTRRSRRK